MKPSLGRIVLFRPTFDVVHSAIITYVHSDTCVNLAAFDSNGNPYGKTSVQLVQDGEHRPNWAFCEWSPHQVAQSQRPEPNVTVCVDPKTVAAMERIIQRIDKELAKDPG